MPRLLTLVRLQVSALPDRRDSGPISGRLRWGRDPGPWPLGLQVQAFTPRRWLLQPLLRALLPLLPLLAFWAWPIQPTSALEPLTPMANALTPPQASAAPASYRCEGDLLRVSYEAGAVDAPDIPNLLAGTAPGAFVVIDWRDQHLQLPRTNNSGVPSYSDGRWWWRALDPQRPEFRQRRGTVISYACEAATGDRPPSA